MFDRDDDTNPATTVATFFCAIFIAILVACTVFLQGCVAPTQSNFRIQPGVTTIEDIRREGARERVTEAVDATGTTVFWHMRPAPGMGRGGLAVLRFCQNGRLERVVSFVKN